MSTIADLPGEWGYLYKSPPELNSDSGGYTARVTFVTTYANLVAFVLIAGGQPQTITSAGGSTMTRIVPLLHPIYSGLWATRISSKAFGTPSETSTALIDLYSHVEVTIDFASVPYGTNGSADPYMTISIKDGGIYTSIPNRKFRFSNGEVLGQDAGQFVGQTTYSITLYQCPDLNDSTLNSLTNKISTTTVLGNPGNQMIFNTYTADYEVLSNGQLNYTKQLFLTYQSHPWNQFYRSDGVLDTPLDPSGNPVYVTADLTQALKL